MSTKKLTGTGILAALVVVLTLLGNVIKIGPFAVTLSLAPIIIGAAVFGTGSGAFLGLVFGLTVLFAGITGMDGGATMLLLNQNAFATILICILKGVAAGFVAGVIYKAVSKKNPKLAVVLAGIFCPITNTGIFILLMMAFFMSTLESWANGQAVIDYVILGMTGINFLIELAINMVLASSITYVIKSVSGRRND